MDSDGAGSRIRKVEAITKIISSVVIAAVGVIITWMYNDRSLKQEDLLRKAALRQEMLLQQSRHRF
jgi:hypothetical protein